MPVVRLRAMSTAYLQTLFEMQLDEEANQMAVTIPRTLENFQRHWEESLVDPNVFARAILLDEYFVGIVSCFPSEGVTQIGYWLDKPVWGKGIATQAVLLLLNEVPIRPIWAKLAASNIASRRVLDKCGFQFQYEHISPATLRYPECLEVVMRLDRCPTATKLPT
jgi:RimJ/RimL family protein N-acetyltransferase